MQRAMGSQREDQFVSPESDHGSGRESNLLTAFSTTGRSFNRVISAAFNPNHYLALSRLGNYCHPMRDFFGRYVLGRGEYPYVCEMNSPKGRVAIHVRSVFDMFTVAEIYNWRCYPITGNELVIVDFGANIGISMGYFLSHAPASHVYGFEALAGNFETAQTNLAGFLGRYDLTQCAVWNKNGTLDFGVEPTGRYSGVDVPQATTRVTVPCVKASAALEPILNRHGAIDVLKVDIEGAEQETLNDLTDAQLGAIRMILVEGDRTPLDRFRKLGMTIETLPSGVLRITWPSGHPGRI
jgi:FkbM family methyltransferase